MATLHAHQSPFFTFTKLIPYSPPSICSPSSYPPITPHTHPTCYHHHSFHHSFPTSFFPFFPMRMQLVCMSTSVHAWPPLDTPFSKPTAVWGFSSIVRRIYMSRTCRKLLLGWERGRKIWIIK